MRRLYTLAALVIAWPAAARTLEVGPDKPFRLPSQAMAAAGNGDTVVIAPGSYEDCAVIRQNGLTIQGAGPGAVLTDRSCAGKAILVIGGNNVTVRNLTLQRARVPDRNGAGIRAEGGNLIVENTRFLDNEEGILAASNPRAEIRVIGSTFTGNGLCAPACAHAIYVNHIALLRVERSHFADTQEGHHIKSRALRTEVLDSDLRDDAVGRSSYLIEAPNGGVLIVERNTMEKGPQSENPGNVIMIGAEGVTQPTGPLLVRDNHFSNDQPVPTTFVHNNTATPAELVGNVFRGDVRPLEGPGSVR